MYHALVMGMLESASGLQAYLNGPSPGEPFVPTELPTMFPSSQPSDQPTGAPSQQPTLLPSESPSETGRGINHTLHLTVCARLMIINGKPIGIKIFI